MHSVDDGCLCVGNDDFVGIQAVRGGRCHGGRHDGDGLVLVVHIGVGAELRIFVGQRLENNELGFYVGRKARGIELKGDLDIALGSFCAKLGRGGNGLLVV